MSAPGGSVIVLDLDDTLYLEREFVRSGYAALGGWMQQRFGVTDFAERAAWVFETGDRSRVFDAVLAGYGLETQAGLIATLVSLYQCHSPQIALAPDAAAWLEQHRHRTRLAIITDGPAATQTNKLRALGLDGGGIAPLVCTGQWGRAYWKPHHRGFEHVMAHYRCAGSDCVYVADNPAKDFIAPRALGWRTVQIVRPGAIHAAATVGEGLGADTVITSFDALDDWLAARGAAGPVHFAGQ
nr:HAD family hydrolase [Polymorphobacter sp.]